MSKRTIIIGAGITGLTLAWAHQRAGRAVTLLEKSYRAGGAIRTIRRDGYLAEAGPNTLLVNKPELDGFLRSLGLGAQMVLPNEAANNRYILKGGEFVAAPLGPGELIRTPLLSGPAKFRLLGDLLAHKPDLREESLASFVERHFGCEALDYVVNPLVGGIYAGDPQMLSAQHAFPQLAEAEQACGSVIRGMMKKRKAKRAAGQHFKTRTVSFRDGMQTLPDAIAAKLGDALQLSANITAIEQTDAGWSVTWRNAAGDHHTETGDELYLTVPAHALPGLPLPRNVSEALAPLAQIEYPPVSVVALGYDRSSVAHALDGFGGLIPEVEGRAALGVLFTSSLFSGRAPEGKVLLTVFIGGARQPEQALQSTEQLLVTAKRECNQLLGAVEPEFVETTTWAQAIPQYNMGYGAKLHAIEHAEQSFSGLRLMGNYRGGISVGQCILNAANAVEPLG